MPNQSNEELETFVNPYSNRKYTIEFTCPEFTSLCPKTGQPDFATVIVRYIPGPECIELKSLKLYFGSYRNQGVFFEAATNRILDDLVTACDPVEMTVIGRFNIRGGISHEITVTYPYA